MRADDLLEKILQEALELPEDARVDLATALLDNVDDEPLDPAEEAWRKEARRRLDGIRSGERTTVPWEKARRLILAPPDETDRRLR